MNGYYLSGPVFRLREIERLMFSKQKYACRKPRLKVEYYVGAKCIK